MDSTGTGTGTGTAPATTAPGTSATATATPGPKSGVVKTLQINLTGGAIQSVDKQVTHTTTTKYLSPFFKLVVSEKGKDKLEKALQAGDRVGVRDFIVGHMATRFGKLESGKEGELYQEAIIIFESMLWKQSLGIP